jgi:5-aminolevulinate synthase
MPARATRRRTVRAQRLLVPNLIVLESVRSMDGDVAPLEGICEPAERYNAMTYLDDVHALGMYRPYGAHFAPTAAIP